MSDENTLKRKLDEKLENGEIDKDEYDALVEKFRSLDLLSSTVNSKEEATMNPKEATKNVVAVGFTKLESEVVDGPVKVSGKFVTTGNLKCESMTISGSAAIAGDLSVIGATKVSGRLSIDGESKFGDVVKVSGKVVASKNVYCTSHLKISGNLQSQGDLVLGGDSKISGKINVKAIRSTSLLKISGNLSTENDVLAKEFICSGGNSTVGGNLQAETIELSKKFRENEDIDSFASEAEELDSIPALGSFISKMVTSFIPNMMKNSGLGKPGEFAVYGDLRGENVDISYTHVKGNVIGKNVIIGPDVVVEGEIHYVDTIEVPDGGEYVIKQIYTTDE